MSDNQRRALCRMVFLLVCVLPTTVVAYWIAHPQTATTWQRELKAQLGVTTEIDFIETPGPYVTILRNLRFTESDLGTLFHAEEVKIEFGEINLVSVRRKKRGLTNRGLTCLVQALNRNIIRSHAADQPWRIVFPQEVVIEEAASLLGQRPLVAGLPPHVVLSDLQINIGPAAKTDDGTFANASFKVINSNLPDVDVYCDLSKTARHGHLLKLQSNGVALPVWLVGEIAEAKSVVSQNLNHAKFAGKFQMSLDPQRSSVWIDGEFRDVDLTLTPDLPLGNRSLAMIELNDCSFANGQLEKWQALLHEPNHAPIEIRQDYLYSPTQSYSFTSAILRTMGLRTARIGETNLH